MQYLVFKIIGRQDSSLKVVNKGMTGAYSIKICGNAARAAGHREF
jgi:hypothetical protein